MTLIRIPLAGFLTPLLILLVLGTSCRGINKGGSRMAPGDDWHLIWSDEFEGPAIDPAKWKHQVFPGVKSGNNELQHYTDRPANSFIRDGCLVIQALREDYEGHGYTSARLHTTGLFSFLYGRVEARIRIPSTKGIWPAFWMMPEHSVYGGWPRSGEIDIMESVNDADETYGTIHFGNPVHQHTGGAYRLADAEGRPVLMSDDFHVYAVEWEPSEIRWYVDGKLFSTKDRWEAPAPFPAPFDQEFHLLLNVAVGGNWPGPPDETSVFPQEMLIDWVRVHQRSNKPPTVAILSPAKGSRLEGGKDLAFRVEASDPEGSLARVALIDRGKVIAESTTPPHDLVYPSIADGCYRRIFVEAYDAGGLRARAETDFIVGIGCPQRPRGEGMTLPGVIEAEEFDEGLEGEAYHDLTAGNDGGAHRPDDGVDLGEINGGGVSVGWTEPGEWVEYTVRVEKAGSYRVVAWAASAEDGGEIALSCEPPAGPPASVRIPVTGDWHAFERCEGGLIQLPQGLVTLRLTIVDGGLNIDRLEFLPAD